MLQVIIKVVTECDMNSPLRWIHATARLWAAGWWEWKHRHWSVWVALRYTEILRYKLLPLLGQWREKWTKHCSSLMCQPLPLRCYSCVIVKDSSQCSLLTAQRYRLSHETNIAAITISFHPSAGESCCRYFELIKAAKVGLVRFINRRHVRTAKGART